MSLAAKKRTWVVVVLLAIVTVAGIALPAEGSIPRDVDDQRLLLALAAEQRPVGTSATAYRLLGHPRAASGYGLLPRAPSRVGRDLRGNTRQDLQFCSWEVTLRNQRGLCRTRGRCTATTIGFHGRPVDEATGLMYFRNRWLDPELGRFVTPDPLGFVDGPSMYIFAGYDPVNMSDPLGLACPGCNNPDLFKMSKPPTARQEAVAREAGAMLVEFTPAGMVTDAAAFFRGRDYLRDDEEFGGVDRFLTGLGMLPLVPGSKLRQGKRLLVSGVQNSYGMAKRGFKAVGDKLGDVVKRTRKRLGRAADVPRKRALLSADEFANLPRSGTIDPSRIRFSQNSINSNFQRGVGPVNDLIAGLRRGSINPSGIPPIRIVAKDGKIFTLDNRRLFAFQEAGVDIPFTRLNQIPSNELRKFTSTNDGLSIAVRIPNG